ncbi:MAG: OmpH family outer membrane protein [Bacteroidales bacterium]|jgi:outer membrane protein|nr:OmpH family outer membrane protein [Bacteroidales bacterium]
MKHLTKVLFIVAAILFTTNVSAQKFGHVDFAKLYQSMPGLDSVQKQYRKYAEGLKKQMDVMQGEFENKFADYNANVTSMSAIIKQTKEKELQDLQSRIESFNSSASQDLQAKEAELTTPLIDRAKKAVQEVAKENGYTYIFNSAEGLLLYATPSDDVILLAKKKLNIK